MGLTDWQNSFIQQYLPYAQQASTQTGLPVDFILGQSALESNWGQSNLAQNQNNFFGIGGPGNFQSYSSPAQGFQAWANLIQNRYNVAGMGGASAQSIAQLLSDQGYTKDPGYAQSVASVTSMVDQYFGAHPNTAGSGSLSGGGNGADPFGFKAAFIGAENWLVSIAGSALFIFLGVVVILMALYMFAVQQGVAPSPQEVVKQAPKALEAVAA